MKMEFPMTAEIGFLVDADSDIEVVLEGDTSITTKTSA